MASASKFNIKNQTKSISLPCRSHPTTCEIEQLLNKIKTTISSPSAEAVCSGLSQLVELYKCMDDLLTSSTTQILMSNGRNKKWVEELVDESINLLDICGGIREMVSEIKDHIRDIRCVLRRRKGETVIEDTVTKYNCFRKKMKKDVKMLVASLKQVENMIMGGGSVVVDSDNHHLVALIKAVIGVSETTVSVFESLLLFFCAPVSKPNRWSIVLSMLIHKGVVACEDKQADQGGVVNEFEKIEATLRILCKYGSINEVKNVQTAQCRLERLGTQIENMEIGLECIFRCLVRTRVSLLNIISL